MLMSMKAVSADKPQDFEVCHVNKIYNCYWIKEWIHMLKKDTPEVEKNYYFKSVLSRKTYYLQKIKKTGVRWQLFKIHLKPELLVSSLLFEWVIAALQGHEMRFLRWRTNWDVDLRTKSLINHFLFLLYFFFFILILPSKENRCALSRAHVR